MHLPKLAFAYNSTAHKSTGFSPFYLLFGRQSILPIDSVFCIENINSYLKNRLHRELVENWRKSMKEAFHLPNVHIKKASNYNKQYYDRKVKGVEVMPGDYVLVRNVKEKGETGKLRNYWESNIFKVIKSNPSLPVYTVKNLHKTRDIRVLHRNLLMRCNELPVEMFEQNRNIRGNRERPSGEVAEKSLEEDDNDDIVINNPCRLIEDRDRILDKDVLDEMEDRDRILDKESTDEIEDRDRILDKDVQDEMEDRDIILDKESTDAIEDRDRILDKDVLYEREDMDRILDQESTDEIDRDRILEKESTDEEREVEEGIPLRKSSRRRIPTRRFTYHNVGGKPLLENTK